MKFKYLLLVIVLIIVAHAVVLFICFRGDSSVPAKKTEEKLVQKEEPAAASQPQKEATVSNADKYRNMSAQAQQGQPAAPAPTASLQVVNKTFPPLNYRYAWKGNIPEIPTSNGVRAGILVDADTGNVLWDKNAKLSFQIASMTKMMTLVLAFEDMASKRNGVSLDSQVKVSHQAQKIGGSQVWLDATETFRLEELLKAVSIKSANDAAYLVGEYLGGGDVHSFVERMNTRARELGMTKTHFNNPHGLPEKSSSQDNMSSPEDMTRLAQRTLCCPKLMEWASTVQTDFRAPGTRGHLVIVNHNNLLPGRKYPATGVDGLKTGYIARAGYCVTVTCLRGGHRMIAVVMGVDSGKNRDLFARKLLDWGYARRANPAAGIEQSRKKALEVQKKKTTPAVSAKKRPGPVRRAVKKIIQKKKAKK